MTKIRSPLFYTGDKYKIISELKKYFPQKINKFIEPFVGGGSVLMNVEANEFYENDIDKNIMMIHKYFSSFNNPNILINILLNKIKYYGLSCSYIDNGSIIPVNLKKQYVKTYYAKYNFPFYKILKDNYNNSNNKDVADLYLLLVYGFNHMLRFNNNGKFNLPVGNVDFNKNVYNAIINYITLLNQKKINWFNEDYISFLKKIKITKNDFIYVDPPYLITSSEYNKIWNQENDEQLFTILDKYNDKKIPFAMSNVFNYKDKENRQLILWSKKYKVIPIKSNYINYHDNSVKTFGEVLIINYDN